MNTILNNFRTFFIVTILLTAISSGQQKEIAEGKAALQAGDVKKAIEKFRDAVDEDNKSGEAYLLLAQTLIKADSLDAATGVLVLWKVMDPNNSMIYVLQGDIYSKQRIPAAAMGEYKKATELDPKNLDAWVQLAEAQRKTRRYKEAATTYQTVLGIDSTNLLAVRELGTILYRGKLYVQALPYVEKLVIAMPDTMDFQIEYVKCLFEAKRYRDLIPYALAILAKDASVTEVQEILDRTYAFLGLNREVIDSYKGRNPETLKIEDLVRYVRALQSEQVNDTAETIYEIIFKMDSSRCDLRYYFGTNEMKLKKWSKAVEQFERKIACDTSSGFQFASHLNAAMSQMQLKKFKDATAHTKEAITHRPENVQAWTVLAECYGQMEQISDEITAYKKVIEIATAGESNGDEGKYTSQLQEAYRMIGVRKLIEASNLVKINSNESDLIKSLFAEAARYLVKAIQLKPGDCEALLWAGQSYQNSNNKDDAIKYYKRTIATCPASKQADEARANLKSLGVE